MLIGVASAAAAPLKVGTPRAACDVSGPAVKVGVAGMRSGARISVSMRSLGSRKALARASRALRRQRAVAVRIPLRRAARDACETLLARGLVIRVIERSSGRRWRTVARRHVARPAASPGPGAVPSRRSRAGVAPTPVGPVTALPTPPPPAGGADPPALPAAVLSGTSRTVHGSVGLPVMEASGLAWSRSDADLLWTHNDSGDSARAIGISSDGSVRAIQPLAGVSAVDIEDIAMGTDRSGGEALLIGDIGDNGAVRPQVRIHRIREPVLTSHPAVTTLPGISPDTAVVSYPDGARDAEALVADRATGDVLVITKREARSRVYRVTQQQLDTGGGVMSFVGEMPYGGIVAADACDDGRTVIAKTYSAIYVHRSDAGPAAALLGAGEDRPYVREPQGEAVAVDAACREYATLSEGFAQPLVRYGP